MILNPQVVISEFDEGYSIFNTFSGDTCFLSSKYSLLFNALKNKSLAIEEILSEINRNDDIALENEDLISEAIKSGIIIENNID